MRASGMPVSGREGAAGVGCGAHEGSAGAKCPQGEMRNGCVANTRMRRRQPCIRRAGTAKPEAAAACTMPGVLSVRSSGAVDGARNVSRRLKAARKSRGTARRWRRTAAIRQKIIGRTMAAVRPRIGGAGGVDLAAGAFAPFHQPACQHGRRVFFQPLIEKCSDLLSQIC